MRLLLSLAFSTSLLAPAVAQDLVAKTDALSPADAQKKFKLPKGFEMQLVAAEPDIQKPMQMAFDAKGRLWVTTSHHYPWAVAAGKGTDKLFVLSDFDDKGKAKSVKIFDDKLNIPIGVLPLPDGKSVIVSECGSILKLTDTDDDGKADKRETLFTGFGFKDTHGMTNSFTPMPDGWIYATHGFANDSKVKGKDGHEVVMNSGHTFRFKADGSRIEVFTRGQVNPFGICVDPWGNLYTACCHSKPITQLIRGAHYDSFGKPHDGLGYGPHVVNHQHGSTGLCGLAWGAGPMFPKEWDGVMFLGNVVTNRINCDRIEWKGSSPVGKEMPDFLSTDDGWFRPVDLDYGPDGALYVADFYNKIVGHYEVDLKHPGRDKDHGRIWRIVWTGEKRTEKLFEPEQFQLDEIKAMRKLAEEAKLTDDQRIRIIATLTDQGRTRRAAIDAVTAQPHADFVRALLVIIPDIPRDDDHMKHAARIALRGCLEAEGGRDAAASLDRTADIEAMLDVSAGLKHPLIFNLRHHLNSQKLSRKATLQAAEMYGRFGDVGKWDDFSEVELWRDNRTVNQRKLFAGECIAAVLRGFSTTHIPNAVAKLTEPRNNQLRATERFIVDLTAHADVALSRQGLTLLQEWKKLGLLQSDPYSRQSVSKIVDHLKDKTVRDADKSQYAHALALLSPEQFRPIAAKWLSESSLKEAERINMLQSLLAKPTVQDNTIAAELLKSANYSFALALATGLAGDGFGADLLLLSIKKGEAPARLLQEKAVVDRLKAIRVKDLDARIAELTKGIPAPEKRIDDLIKKRGEGFKNFKPDLEKGKAIFAKNCAICHQVNNEGAKVGPQLDGIGIRGIERLLEDTLDPSRNVDAAFKSTTLQLLDGRNPSGLVREDGAVYVLIDNLGKENRIPAKDVDKVVKSNVSSMPANVDAIIPEGEYYHLLAFLLSQRPK